jgi:transcription initiation factor TFIID TATA-box-binding protein
MSIQQSISVENVVATTSIGRELNLNSLALDLDGVDYDPEQFPGVIYRTNDPEAAALIFRSGKIVCTGADSVDAAHESINIVSSMFSTLDIDMPDELDIAVQNIVSSGDLGTKLNLNAIAIGLGLEHVEYEPEQFPGLVYRLEEDDVVLLLFGSGKVVITGGKDPDDAHRALDTVRKELDTLGLLS